MLENLLLWNSRKSTRLKPTWGCHRSRRGGPAAPCGMESEPPSPQGQIRAPTHRVTRPDLVARERCLGPKADKEEKMEAVVSCMSRGHR